MIGKDLVGNDHKIEPDANIACSAGDAPVRQALLAGQGNGYNPSQHGSKLNLDVLLLPL